VQATHHLLNALAPAVLAPLLAIQQPDRWRTAQTSVVEQIVSHVGWLGRQPTTQPRDAAHAHAVQLLNELRVVASISTDKVQHIRQTSCNVSALNPLSSKMVAQKCEWEMGGSAYYLVAGMCLNLAL
jgi:hypothetical protein